MMHCRLNKRLIVSLISAGVVFSLCSCSTDNKDEPVVTERNISEDSNGDFVDSDAVMNDFSFEEEKFDYFYSDMVDIERLVEEGKIEEIKSKAKEVFITGVDFIFYDVEISGVSFDELTEAGKEITMNNLESLGDMVDQVVPGWREDMSEKYRIASHFFSDVYLSGLDKIREYLGDENYEALGNIKDQILGDVHGTYEDVKGHVKSWYEEFRSRK